VLFAQPDFPVCFDHARHPDQRRRARPLLSFRRAINAALAALCDFSISVRKPYFGWWAGAWGLYFLRIAAITSILLTSHRIGYTGTRCDRLDRPGSAYAALVFSQQVRWRPWYLALVLFRRSGPMSPSID